MSPRVNVVNNEQLLEYINRCFKRGKKPDEVQNELTAIGWQPAVVEEALNALPAAGQTRTGFQPKRLVFNKQIISVLVIFCFLIAGGVFAYNRFVRSPEWVIHQAVDRFGQSQSFEYRGRLSLKVKTGDPTADLLSSFLPGKMSTLLLQLRGQHDRHDRETPKTATVIDFSLAGLSVSLETRTVGDTVYLRFSQAPDLGLIDPRVIGNQWLKVDFDRLADWIGSEYQEAYQQARQHQLELVFKIKKDFRENLADVVRVVEKLPDEEVDEVTTHHYRLAVDQDELVKLYADLMAVLNEEAGADSTDLKETRDTLNKLVEKTDLPDGEVWIGKQDLLPRKLLVKWRMGEGDLAGVVLTLTVEFNKYDQPIPIEIPAGARPIEELTGILFGQAPGIDLSTVLPDIPN